MKLQYVASACVLVEHAGVRVLCDPWLTDGIYGGAWYHNPPLAVTPEDFCDIHYIYVSHIHPDHADFATLARLPRVPVLVGRYAEAFLAGKLRAMGFPVHELPHDQPYAIGPDFTIQIVPADNCDPKACGRWIGCQIANAKEGASYQVDTLAVFKGGDQIIVNVNDVPYGLGQQAVKRVKQQYGAPDLLCVGYAGAGPWPQCFGHLTDDQKRIAAGEKCDKFIRQARAFVDDFTPKAFLPFAGQYTLGGPLVDLNGRRGIPELTHLDDFFQNDQRLMRLNRMAWFDCETGQPSEPWEPDNPDEKDAYQESLRSSRLDHEADAWPTNAQIASLLDEAERAMWARCQVRGFSSPWIVELIAKWPDAWLPRFVTFQPDADIEHAHVLTIEVDARLLKRILTRTFNMNNAEIGSLLTYYRTPDIFDNGSFVALSYLHV